MIYYLIWFTWFDIVLVSWSVMWCTLFLLMNMMIKPDDYAAELWIWWYGAECGRQERFRILDRRKRQREWAAMVQAVPMGDTTSPCAAPGAEGEWFTKRAWAPGDHRLTARKHEAVARSAKWIALVAGTLAILNGDEYVWWNKMIYSSQKIVRWSYLMTN